MEIEVSFLLCSLWPTEEQMQQNTNKHTNMCFQIKIKDGDVENSSSFAQKQ